MKKLFFSAVVLMLSTVTFAHDVPQFSTPISTENASIVQDTIGYLKIDGKMFVLKGEDRIEMAEDVTLKNGTTVTKEGIVTPKGGEAVTLENGQYVDPDGNIKTWKEGEK